MAPYAGVIAFRQALELVSAVYAPIATKLFTCIIFNMNDTCQIDINKTIDQLMSMKAKNRLDAIIDSPRPMELVHALSASEVLTTIKEIGAEDSLSLIELLKPEQVQAVLDLEIWHHDQIEPQKAGAYFSLLFAADTKRAIKQIHGLDIELIALMMKMSAEIYDTSLGEEPENFSNIVIQSPDGRFIVNFKDTKAKQALSYSLKAYLESLFEKNIKTALGLLEDIRFELASGLEENSLRMRQNRMMDMGILPHDERLKFFCVISPKELNSLKPEEKHLWNFSEQRAPTKRFADQIEDKNFPFLKAAIDDLPHLEQSQALENLAFVAVNLHASLCGDFGDSALIKKSADYAKALVEIALVQLSGGQSFKAKECFTKNSLTNLARLGRTSLVGLRKALRIVLENPDCLLGKDLSCLDYPLKESAQALLQSEPRFYAGLSDAKLFEARFFSSISDIKAMAMAINEIKFRSLFLGSKGLNVPLEKLEQGLSHSQIYARYLLNLYCEKAFSLTKTSSEKMAKIFTQNQVLQDEFSNFAKNMANTLAKILQRSYKDLPCEELAQNFVTTILIQLQHNHALLLG